MNATALAPSALPPSALQPEMIKRLVLMDWYFLRWAIAGYLAAGAVALVLVGTGGEASFYIGSILLITILIGVGIHLAMATVIQERTDHTLPFVMSLPISPRDYTTAKVLANVLIFLIPWLALTLGSFAVIAGRRGIPHGLIAFVAVLLGELFVSYILILATALVTESQGWTIGVMVTLNLAFQGFLYFVSHLPSLAAVMKGDAVVWPPAALALLAAELAVILLALGLTFFFQARKTDFL
jgi:ABC-2 type transport system permease protein